MTTTIFPTQTVDEYKELLKKHDWYYDYSDDFSVYEKGLKEYKTLIESRRTYDPEFEIWNTLCPTDCRHIKKD